MNLVLVFEKSEVKYAQFQLFEMRVNKSSEIPILCYSVQFSYSEKMLTLIVNQHGTVPPFTSVVLKWYHISLFVLLENTGCQKLSNVLS